VYILASKFLIFNLCYFPKGHAKPWRWGPASNTGPIGGPAWNGGEQSTDNIIIHANGNGNRGGGKWRY
ncbi:hypothetical protein KR032_011233, partial [Drosophila birchii]